MIRTMKFSFLMLCLFCLPIFCREVEQTQAQAELVEEQSLSNSKHEQPQAELVEEKALSNSKKRKLKKEKKRDEKVRRNTFSHMSYNELKEAKDEARTQKNNPIAIKYLEKMVKVCDDLNDLKSIMLELADVLYDSADYVRSSEMYAKFVRLYPSGDDVEYASYRSIASSFQLILDEEHDQTKTEETKELAELFLERADVFVKYTDRVKDIKSRCEERLLASEINIFQFYLKRGSMQSAESRLNTIKNDFLSTDLPDVRLRIAQLEADVTANKLQLDGVVAQSVATQQVAMNESSSGSEVSEKPKKFVDRF